MFGTARSALHDDERRTAPTLPLIVTYSYHDISTKYLGSEAVSFMNLDGTHV